MITHRPLLKQQIKRLMKQYKNPYEVYFVLENIEYARNVASVFRIADAVRVKKIYLTGISAKPPFGKDIKKVSRSKEMSVDWEYRKDTGWVINHLKKIGVTPIALELTNLAEPLPRFEFPQKFALIVGNENYGITRKTLAKIYKAVYIPMYGRGASLNVHVSLAIVAFEALFRAT